MHDAELFIALITPYSIQSPYVLFELGARWGAGKDFIPLLASGAGPQHLGGPLSGINALNCSVTSQVHQLVEDSAEILSVKPSAASAYLKPLNALVDTSKVIVPTRDTDAMPAPKQQIELSQYENQILTEHQKLIAVQSDLAWRQGLENPHPILYISREGRQALKIDFSPFVQNAHVSYFESHLMTGYTPLWKKIQQWRDSYSTLVKRAHQLASKIRNLLEDSDILPSYHVLKQPTQYIKYPMFLEAYFHTIWFEIEQDRTFEVKLRNYTRNTETLYTLKLSDNTFADSPNKQKILGLKQLVEQLHNDRSLHKEFLDIYGDGTKLNNQLRELLSQLNQLWVQVQHNVKLEGSCDAGTKGKYEK